MSRGAPNGNVTPLPPSHFIIIIVNFMFQDNNNKLYHGLLVIKNKT